MAAKKKVCEGERLIVFARGTWEFAERRKVKVAVAVVAITRQGELLLT